MSCGARRMAPSSSAHITGPDSVDHFRFRSGAIGPRSEAGTAGMRVFGPEDGSLDRAVLGLCHRFVVIPTRPCTNLAAAVYTVLYDRHAKRVAAGLEPVNTLAESRGFDEPDHLADVVGLR